MVDRAGGERYLQLPQVSALLEERYCLFRDWISAVVWHIDRSYVLVKIMLREPLVETFHLHVGQQHKGRHLDEVRVLPCVHQARRQFWAVRRADFRNTLVYLYSLLASVSGPMLLQHLLDLESPLRRVGASYCANIGHRPGVVMKLEAR